MLEGSFMNLKIVCYAVPKNGVFCLLLAFLMNLEVVWHWCMCIIEL